MEFHPDPPDMTAEIKTSASARTKHSRAPYRKCDVLEMKRIGLYVHLDVMETTRSLVHRKSMAVCERGFHIECENHWLVWFTSKIS